MSSPDTVIRCPVCGGKVTITNEDKVNFCEYCSSPILGPSQSRDCVNHPGVLATEVCHVCGDLICDECTQKRVGDYGGKLLTIVNCSKPSCVAESSWAKPLNAEYQKLANMDWADKADNYILRITGVGAVIMMVFELVFILGMLYFQYFTPFGSLIPTLGIYPGIVMIVLMIIGNLIAAVMMQTALQVYIHDRQLSSGVLLLVLLIIEASYLLWRGLFFNLRQLQNPFFLPMLLIAFIFGTLLIFVGSLGAIYIGNKKRIQINNALKQLGLKARKSK